MQGCWSCPFFTFSAPAPDKFKLWLRLLLLLTDRVRLPTGSTDMVRLLKGSTDRVRLLIGSTARVRMLIGSTAKVSMTY